MVFFFRKVSPFLFTQTRGYVTLAIGSAASPPMHRSSAKDNVDLVPLAHWQEAGFPNSVFAMCSEYYFALTAE